MKNWMHSLLASLERREPPIFVGVFIGLVVFRIWLITGIPMIYYYAPHDDLFFAKAAHYIINGQWMGPYSQMTLIKVPFYSFFLIVSFLTGLPLFLNETLFYVLACLALYFALSPLVRSRWRRLAVFAFLLFCPASLATGSNLRVGREFVYFSLTLCVVASCIGLFLRLAQRFARLVPWSIGLGLAMGAFMITREEGVWIYPVLLTLLVICVLLILLRKLERKWLRSAIVLLPILLWNLPINIVSSLNYSHYGFWGATEQLDPDFQRVLNTLARIKSTNWYPFIPITQEARLRAYKASPLFHQLRDSLESAVILWQASDDASTNGKPQWYLQQYTNGGPEIGAHFMWALRDVVAGKGFYSTGKRAHAFYRRLADQLEAACNHGSLDCAPPRNIPFIGALDSRDYPIILRMFSEDMLRLLVPDQSLPYIAPGDLDIRAWPAYNDAFQYFDEFDYNPMDSQKTLVGNDTPYVVAGSTDVRLRALALKRRAMDMFVAIYRVLTLPLFAVALLGWCASLILAVIRRLRGHEVAYLIISAFMVGLLFSRVMMLTIVDATTSVPGVPVYGASSLLFIYVFSSLMLCWISKEIGMRRRGLVA